jgi:UDP-N-acetylmuramate dehydrogenase
MNIVITENLPLKDLNTFGMDVAAPYFSALTIPEDCALLSSVEMPLPKLVIGGGSNMLFTTQPNYWFIKNEIKGIEIIGGDEQSIQLRVGAGEIWHEFVMHCVSQHFCGLENLALIPGTVGAAPIQNIGAYGVEVKQRIIGVHYWNLEANRFEYLANEDCRFGYRDSIFKQELKGKFIITQVDWQLSKVPEINVSYGNIKDQLQQDGIVNPDIKDVANAVIAIRSSKLPDPKEIGNAGSFFKNPEVSNSVYEALKAEYAPIPGYSLPGQITKIPAAWLIEQCGWKGYRAGDAGVHHIQPLVLVNYGNATGREIYDLSEQIIQSVKDKFGITLEREVQIF